MLKGCGLSFLTLITSLILIFLAPRMNEKNIATIITTDFKLGIICIESPCLFGVSLRGANEKTTKQILQDSNLADSLEITATEPYIQWIWTKEFGKKLNIIDRNEDDNFVTFGEGQVNMVSISFIVNLGTIIQIYGNPSFVVPYGYNNWGNMHYLIAFEKAEGYFVATTLCDKPLLEADTSIIGHFSYLKTPYISSDIINWQGYTSDLPDCTIFQG
jgi:hypothetical protein